MSHLREYCLHEAARLLGCGRREMHRRIAAGLPYIARGRRYYFTAEALERWQRENATVRTAPSSGPRLLTPAEMQAQNKALRNS